MALFATVLFLLLSGCHGENGQISEDTEQRRDITVLHPVHPPTGTIRLPLGGSIATLDPGLISDITTMEVASQLFLGLTQFDPYDYTPKPALAESWQSNDDATVYRFTLRADARWSDGTPITANDVVWAIQRNLAPGSKAPYLSSLFVLKNGKAYHEGTVHDLKQVGVRAENLKTVVFTLAHPSAYFPALVNLWPFRPLPRRAIQKGHDNWTQPEYIVSSGPYRLTAWERGKLLRLERNPNYYDHAQIHIDTIVFYIVRESTVGLRMYEQGELDLMGGNFLPLPQSAMTRISRDPALNERFHHQPDFCTYFYGFNTRKPPTDNPLVRKAISAAINKRLIIQLVTKGGEEPAYTLTRPPIFGSVPSDSGIGIHFDPRRAKEWLEEAGYPDGKGFPGIVLMHNISETHAAIAKAIKTMLEFYLHIKVTIKELDWEQYNQAIGRTDATNMFRYGWCADYPDANNWLSDLFHPDNSSNLIHWNNRRFADLIDRAKQERTPKVRKQLYHQAEKILNQTEAAIVPISFSTAAYLVAPRVKSWFHMALGGQHIGEWQLADAKQRE